MRQCLCVSTSGNSLKYRGLDLNLLLALDALLRTRSVSRSADFVNITQPAMSAALSRLRTFFDDKLLVAAGGGQFVLTPLAQSLQGPVGEVLRTIDKDILAPSLFDPAMSDREIRILAADTVVLNLIAGPLSELAEHAPRLRFDITSPAGDMAERLDAGLIDLLIAPAHLIAPEHPSELFIEEEHYLMGCADNVSKREIDLDAYKKADHVEVYIGPARRPYLSEDTLSALGIQRRISVKLDHFSLVPAFLIGTERLATFPSSPVYQKQFPQLRFAPLPFHLPKSQLFMQWHTHAQADSGLTWLRNRIKARIQDV